MSSAPTQVPTQSTMRSALTIGNYRLGKTLGIGSFGKVKVAEHIYTGNKVAIKILNRRKIKNLRMDEKIRREIHNLKLFRHPHIIKLYEVIETPTDIFMVMECIHGGELFDYIVQHGKLLEDESRRLFQQIVSGVEYCHSHMVVHRDLKPENLLLDTVNFSVKIADFGLSNMMQDGDFLKTSCGSPNYAAPEVISGRLYAGPEVDVWSCGVILYALLCAKLPFDDEYIPSLFKKIREGIFVIPEHISPSCADLIRQMLVVDPLKRMTMSEIKKHPWFQVRLPKYLSYTPLGVTRHIQDVDPSVISELVLKYRDPTITKERVEQEVRKSSHGEVNEFIVAYHLLNDAKKNPYDSAEGTVDTTEAEFQNLRVGEVMFQFEDSPPDNPDTSLAAVGPSKKWFLGVLSTQTPQSIMLEVFRALKDTGFCWKVIGPYQLRCKTVIDEPELKNVGDGKFWSGKHSTVKITLQLFKVSERKYLLDFKKIEGDIFPFFDTCSSFLSELNL